MSQIHPPAQVDIGQRIAQLRERAGLTQRGMADSLGYSQTWLQAIESGRNGIKAVDLAAMALLLEVPVAALLDPDYSGAGKRPATRLAWDLWYPGEPELADAHFNLDKVWRRMREVASGK